MKYLMVIIIAVFATKSNADECKSVWGPPGATCSVFSPEYQQYQQLQQLETQQLINRARQRRYQEEMDTERQRLEYRIQELEQRLNDR